MKLIVSRFTIPQGGDSSTGKKPPGGRRRKVMTLLLGTALTLGVCLAAEMIPARDSLPTLAAADGQTGTPLPVIYYPQIVADGEKGDSKAALPVSLLEKDLDWLAENGYQTVSCSGLISGVRGMEKLPEKPVLLVFGGSWQSILTEVCPLLAGRQDKGAAVIVGSDADLYSADVPKKAGEAKLSWEDIRAVDPAVLDLVSGSYSLDERKGADGRKGVAKRRGESFSAYRAFLADDLLAMQQRMNEELSHDASVFCYPFGELSEESEAVLKELGFLATLYEGKGTALLTDSESLYGIPFLTRKAGRESSAFFEKAGLLAETEK
ncbi:MAG: polysaccharide deacetylase family protein [Oscillospiraceae bacterium]|jgi:hypothetical protein|nr:polysaccharide deacetylase family protein [Oscillospiraceae bacterium]